MKCPRTGTKLKPVKLGPIQVEISEKCGGVFFDQKELELFNDPADIKGNVLVKHLTQFDNDSYDPSARVRCPKCPDTIMMRRYESPAHIVEIDECPSCAGIWLDTGELKLLRDNHLSQKERALLREELIRDTEASQFNSISSKNSNRDSLGQVFRLTEYLLPW
ncbi:zf-TFIIB domain-containing protein [uncultured Psychrosphaera sp.]|uniref:TFIIB-type zinc ribbon-containing protein n=1 Tax=uncultured Psychrosphaera sp. TaxID=1403522 RepID=UPI002637B57E|nr:zf-TFIIB domain-containing protein [uncultured Psychrosphaera sp.]